MRLAVDGTAVDFQLWEGSEGAVSANAGALSPHACGASSPARTLTWWVLVVGRPAAARIGHNNNDHWDDGPASDPGHYFICERYP